MLITNKKPDNVITQPETKVKPDADSEKQDIDWISCVKPDHDQDATPPSNEVDAGKNNNQAVPELEKEIASHFDESLGRARKAYAAYVDAQKEMWIAYQETEKRVEDDFIVEVQAASKRRDESIEQALIARQKADQEAEQALSKAIQDAHDNYRKAKNQVDKSNEEALVKSHTDYRQDIENAKTGRTKALGEAWKLFSRVS